MAFTAHRYQHDLRLSLVTGTTMGVTTAAFLFPWLVDSIARFANAGLLSAALQFAILSLLFFWKVPLTILAFSIVLRLRYRRLLVSRTLAFALVATVAEMIAPQFFEWHWGTLPASENRIAQLAEFTGVSGITFILFALGYMLYRLLRFGRFLRRKRTRRLCLRRIPVWRLVAPFVLIAGLLFWGGLREQVMVLREHVAPDARVALLQTNTPPAPLGQGRTLTQQRLQQIFYREIPDLVREAAEARSFGRLDLVVLPEAAVPYYSTEENALTTLSQNRIYAPVFLNLMRWTAHTIQAPVLFNEDVRRTADGDSATPYRTYNAATIMSETGERQDTYLKRHLAPGEENPMRIFLGGLARLLPTNALRGRYAPGGQANLLTYDAAVQKTGEHTEVSRGPTGRLLPLICSEGLLTRYPAEFPGEFDFMVNIVQDRWYGSQERHLAFAAVRLRAIEYRKSLVRVTNGGLSAVVGPSGRLMTPIIGDPMTGIDVSATQITVVPILSERTFYSTYGRLWVLIPTLVVVLGAVFREIRRRRLTVQTAQHAGSCI